MIGAISLKIPKNPVKINRKTLIIVVLSFLLLFLSVVLLLLIRQHGILSRIPGGEALIKAYVFRGFKESYATQLDPPMEYNYVVKLNGYEEEDMYFGFNNPDRYLQDIGDRYVLLSEDGTTLTFFSKTKKEKYTVPVPKFEGDSYFTGGGFNMFPLEYPNFFVNIGYAYAKGDTLGVHYLYNDQTREFSKSDLSCPYSGVMACTSINEVYRIAPGQFLLSHGMGDSCWRATSLYILNTNINNFKEVGTFEAGCGRDGQQDYLGYHEGIIYARIDATTQEETLKENLNSPHDYMNIRSVVKKDPLTNSETIILNSTQLPFKVNDLVMYGNRLYFKGLKGEYKVFDITKREFSDINENEYLKRSRYELIDPNDWESSIKRFEEVNAGMFKVLKEVVKDKYPMHVSDKWNCIVSDADYINYPNESHVLCSEEIERIVGPYPHNTKGYFYVNEITSDKAYFRLKLEHSMEGLFVANGRTIKTSYSGEFDLRTMTVTLTKDK